MALQPFTGQLDPVPPAPALKPFTGELDPVKGEGGGVLQNIGAGIARGAKDVIDTGAQMLASGFDKIAGTKEGERVQAMNKAGTAEFDRDYGGSTAASVGRVGGQVLATLPVGGALGAGARAAGATALGDAIATGGLRAGGASLATRAAGGAIQGGATAGLVNPDDAAAGAVVGAGLPLAARALGAAGGAIGRTIAGPATPPGVLQAAQDAQSAGFTLPPSTVRPTLANQALEGLGGKIKTAQQASARNQAKVNDLVASELGLQPGQQVTPDMLTNIRRQAGQAYDAVSNVGTITPTKAYDSALDAIIAPYQKAAQGFQNAAPNPIIDTINSLRTPAFDAGSGIAKIRELRDMADAAYRRGDKDIGRALKNASGAIENAIETHLTSSGANPALVAGFRDARQTIAKTYSVESALNGTTGDVSARKLAAQLARGKPLSGNLESIARSAQAFEKAFQDPSKIGSQTGFSPLDWAFAGGLGAATGGSPLSLAGMVARPTARAASLSEPVQRRLTQPQGPIGRSLASLSLNPSAAALLGRAAPVALTGPDQ